MTAGAIGPVIVNHIREYEKSLGVPSDKLYAVTMHVLAGQVLAGPWTPAMAEILELV